MAELHNGTDEKLRQVNYLEGARRRLESEALRYARMKAFGIYEEGGKYVHVSNSDIEGYLTYFTSALHQAAMALLLELQAVELPPREEQADA